jgi:uncharacterized membrane-anchored protein
LWRGDTVLAGLLRRATPEWLAQSLRAARDNLDHELLAFAHNTLEYLRHDEERALLLDPVGAVPDVRVCIAGGPCWSWCAAKVTRPTCAGWGAMCANSARS